MSVRRLRTAAPPRLRCGPLLMPGLATALLITACGCAGAVTPAANTITTVSTSAASTSLVQAVDPDPATSSNDFEPVDIPITPSADPAVVNTPAAGAAATLVVTGDTFDHPSVSIPIGGVVTFRSGDGAAHGIIVGSLSSVTVTAGYDEFYQFPLAGSFEVTVDRSSATASIVVQ